MMSSDHLITLWIHNAHNVSTRKEPYGKNLLQFATIPVKFPKKKLAGRLRAKP
jgi:hypothetical protein